MNNEIYNMALALPLIQFGMVNLKFILFRQRSPQLIFNRNPAYAYL